MIHADVKQLKKQKRWRFFAIVLAAVLCCVSYLYYENTSVEVSEISISGQRIPKEFEGYKIVHLSDVHNTEFGESNIRLISKIEAAKPDAICITGDLIDCRKTNMELALRFIEKALKIAPVYYVTGNHEANISAYKDFASQLKNLGVILMDNKAVSIERAGEQITLMGFADPSFSYGQSQSAAFSKALDTMNIDSDSYKILLSHRPEAFDFYAKNSIDLILCGHTHGGQVRLPFIGALMAPNQGWFPKYSAGLYENGESKMIVSRGLGNSRLPIRINCKPELIVVSLQSGML